MSEQPWRVDEDEARNIYREGEYVAVVLGDEALAGFRAREMVAVLNYAEQRASVIGRWGADAPTVGGAL